MPHQIDEAFIKIYNINYILSGTPIPNNLNED